MTHCSGGPRRSPSTSFTAPSSASEGTLSTPWRSLLTLIGVFFFWGFVAASNDILIPVFKQALNLEQAQSQMISFAFYVAYTLGSLIYLWASSQWSGPDHKDLISRWGYSKALAYGLLVSALGTLLFIPAADQASFPLLLAGLMVVGLGFSLQQTVANPLVLMMGPASGGPQRLSMAGGINNLGTTLGPLLVSYAIFGPMGTGASSAGGSAEALDLSAVKTPYLVLGALFTLAALVFYFKDLGRPGQSNTEGDQEESERPVFSLPQVWGGMIAIFLYVGVEVATASNLPEYLRAELGMPIESLAPYVALFWASLMIGRWTGTAAMVKQGFGGLSVQVSQWIMRLILPSAAFGVFLLVTYLGGHSPWEYVAYSPALLILILADAWSGGKADRQLALYSVMGMVALLYGMLAPPATGVYALIAVGLCCSTLWPCIFALAVKDMGSATTKVSSALIMMIMGGGFVSVLQGYLAGFPALGIRGSFVVGIVCFAYLAYYALVLSRRGSRVS
ncbi:MAG: MFS transporter [Bacteroidetes bacterium]|nr:MFS transporter [Bacteroidota bacterium]